MSISVVIATRNRHTRLAGTLDALAQQVPPPGGYEVVVADNGSADATHSVVAEAAARPGGPCIRYIQVEVVGKSHAVNAALQEASGEILAFTDDDVMPEREWLIRLSAAMGESGADFAAGRMGPLWEAAPPSWLSPGLYGVLAISDNGDRRLPIALGINEHIVAIGANLAVRADVVRRIGGLRPDLGKLEGSLRTGEDHEFFLRMLHAGYRGIYEPAALVHHWVPRERLCREYFRRWLYQNGRDVAVLERAYAQPLPYLFGIPRYLWRRSVLDLGDAAWATLTRQHPRRFAATLRILWVAGYVRQTWLGAVPTRAVSWARSQ